MNGEHKKPFLKVQLRNLRKILLLCSIVSVSILSFWLTDAHSATNFYVDPDYNGSTKNGTASNPWSTLTNSAWSTINSILEADDVTIYFSAKEADGDINESTSNSLVIKRTTMSNVKYPAALLKTLVLDGNSLYNNNDLTPNWVPNPGSYKHEIKTAYPINTETLRYRHYVTIKGFKAVPSVGQGIYYWGGVNVVIEENEVHPLPSVSHGPGIMFVYGRFENDDEEPCVPDGKHNCGMKNIIIRNNTIHDTYGEALYIGGLANEDAGSILYAKENVLIENNIIYNAGIWGGEADGIDIKPGVKDLIVRGNTIYHTNKQISTDGIVSMSAGIIENNFIHSVGDRAIGFGTYWNAYSTGFRDKLIIRNNIIVNSGGNNSRNRDSGIYIDGSSSGEQFTNGSIVNNTIYGIVDGPGIIVNRNATNFDVRNNLVSNSDGTEIVLSGGTTTHGFNLAYDLSGTVYSYNGSGRVCSSISEISATSICQDPLLRSPEPPYLDQNFTINVGSPAIESADLMLSFSYDYRYVSRGPLWDLGAYEWDVLPSPPSNLKIIP